MLKRTVLALGPAVWVLILGLWIGPKYDRFVLPAFDGHVYDTMAESPRVFTLAPWGYRILEPWMVHLLPASSSAVAFFWLNLFLLAGTVFVVGSWLRRLGFSSASAALASAAFAASPPVRVILDYQVLVDPLSVFLLVLTLRELCDPDLPTLAALAATAALTKETGLVALVLIPVVLIGRRGVARGLFDSVVVSAPAIVLAVVLRLTWGSPGPPLSPLSVLETTVGRITASSIDLIAAAAMPGLILPVLVGLFREPSLSLRVQGVLLWLSTFGLIVANPYHYSASDLSRLSVFFWPAILPLALTGLGFLRTPEPNRPPKARSPLRSAAALATLAVCMLLVAITDPYLRAPFPVPPDPVALVGRIRETMKTARAIDQGETFEFDARSGRFAQPIAERFNLTEGRRQRWFLYGGFGREAPFEAGPPEFQREAQLLLPVLTPRRIEVQLEFWAPDNAQITIGLADRDLASIGVGPSGGTFTIPAALLSRGDNLLGLREPSGKTIRLVRFTARLKNPGAPQP